MPLASDLVSKRTGLRPFDCDPLNVPYPRNRPPQPPSGLARGCPDRETAPVSDRLSVPRRTVQSRNPRDQSRLFHVPSGKPQRTSARHAGTLFVLARTILAPVLGMQDLIRPAGAANRRCGQPRGCLCSRRVAVPGMEPRRAGGGGRAVTRYRGRACGPLRGHGPGSRARGSGQPRGRGRAAGRCGGAGAPKVLWRAVARVGPRATREGERRAQGSGIVRGAQPSGPRASSGRKRRL